MAVAPLYRSQLKLINLALVATVPVIEKHGIDAILKPVINMLASAGISVVTNGQRRTYKEPS